MNKSVTLCYGRCFVCMKHWIDYDEGRSLQFRSDASSWLGSRKILWPYARDQTACIHVTARQHCNDVQDLHGNSRLSATKMGSSISNKWSRLHSLLQHLQFSGTSKLDFSYKADSLDVEWKRGPETNDLVGRWWQALYKRTSMRYHYWY